MRMASSRRLPLRRLQLDRPLSVDRGGRAQAVVLGVDGVPDFNARTMDKLVKMTIYVVDIKKNTEVWRARREFFSGDFPASTLVEVRSLAKPEVLVEIETVAWLGGS